MAAAASVASGGIGTGQTLLAGHENEKLLKFQRDNIAIQRNISKQMFEQKEKDVRKNASRNQAAARVAMSGSGVDYTSGSFAAVQEDQMLQNEMAALNVRYQGEISDVKYQNDWNLKDFQKDQAHRDKVLNTAKSGLSLVGSSSFQSLFGGGS